MHFSFMCVYVIENPKMNMISRKMHCERRKKRCMDCYSIRLIKHRSRGNRLRTKIKVTYNVLIDFHSMSNYLGLFHAKIFKHCALILTFYCICFQRDFVYFDESKSFCIVF